MKTLNGQQVSDIRKLDKSNWKLVSFGDVTREARETANDPVAEGIRYVVGLEHLNPLDIHIRSWANTEDGPTFTRKFKKGQILFGKRRAYQRKAAIADFDGVCSGDILVLETNEEEMESGLLPFLVHSDEFFNQVLKTSAGSLSPRTKYKDLANFKFRLPPRPLQKKFAELLWTHDRLEENLFKVGTRNSEVFIALINNLSNALEGKKDIFKLKDVVNILDHKRKPLNESERSTMKGDIPYYGSNGLVDRVNQFLFDEELVLVAEDGGYFLEYLHKPIAFLISGKSWVNNHAHVLQAKPGFSNKWTYYSLVHKNIIRHIRGSTRTKLNKGELEELEIWVPDEITQKKIILQIQLVEKVIATRNEYEKRTKLLRNSLVNEIFTL